MNSPLHFLRHCVSKLICLAIAQLLILSAFAAVPEVNIDSGPTTSGSRAVLKNDIALAPDSAPLTVKRAIWAANSLRNQPYLHGGGHEAFLSNGYDCSGAVSFVLHYAGLLDAPYDSREFSEFGKSGVGKWITIYTRNGHTFLEIAGLRFDTTGAHGKENPCWHNDSRELEKFVARHPDGY